MSRKNPKLKADQYACVGGPLSFLYLPQPTKADPLDALPQTVKMPDGIYIRQVGYSTEGKATISYQWESP